VAGLRGRTAVVTGSTRGLGEHFARRLFDDGASVLVTGRNGERAREIANELDPSGRRAHGVRLDVTSRESFAQVIEEARQRWESVDILVNNAGVTPSTSFLDVDDAEWDLVLETNLRSVFIGCQLVAPIMRDQGHGRIVNHSSLAGQQGGRATGPHYAAAKAGIIVLTKIVARELASAGVTVNAIAPASIAGEAMDEIRARMSTPPSPTPVGREGRPEEVAALVAFLASDEAGYITGATLDVNGGLFMR
jgi:3-oxoacyl-[acyl-carrier protein] reductase